MSRAAVSQSARVMPTIASRWRTGNMQRMLLVARTRNPLTFATFMRLGPWPNNRESGGGENEYEIWTRSVRHDFLIDLKGTQRSWSLYILNEK